jgi:hypothetical protein
MIRSTKLMFWMFWDFGFRTVFNNKRGTRVPSQKGSPCMNCYRPRYVPSGRKSWESMKTKERQIQKEVTAWRRDRVAHVSGVKMDELERRNVRVGTVARETTGTSALVEPIPQENILRYAHENRVDKMYFNLPHTIATVFFSCSCCLPPKGPTHGSAKPVASWRPAQKQRQLQQLHLGSIW